MLPNGSITHETRLFLDFLSLRPGIANVQFAIIGHGEYNLRTMRIEYAVADGTVRDRQRRDVTEGGIRVNSKAICHSRSRPGE